MKKIKLMVIILVASISTLCYAANPIPDPMVQIATPPMGLPGATPISNPYGIQQMVQPQGELFIQGVFIATDADKNKGKYNKVYMNGGFYKVNEIINDTWKVKSISRKVVEVVNLETKVLKKINISGE